jgi:cupin 2 domain-containing protein
VLAVQVHLGPPMTIQYKGFLLKALPDNLLLIPSGQAAILPDARKVAPRSRTNRESPMWVEPLPGCAERVVTMAVLTNLYADIPLSLPEELVRTLLSAPGFRIERIVSLGQASPEGFWYDQETLEWVLLLAGAARLTLEGEEPLDLLPGAFLNIPAHQRHRVEWTDPEQPTIWLAIHYREQAP